MTAKYNWQGKCRICGKKTNLSTIRITKEIGITFWIVRSCDDCQNVITNAINNAIFDITVKNK